jgi:hypothetical protein
MQKLSNPYLVGQLSVFHEQNTKEGLNVFKQTNEEKLHL